MRKEVSFAFTPGGDMSKISRREILKMGAAAGDARVTEVAAAYCENG